MSGTKAGKSMDGHHEFRCSRAQQRSRIIWIALAAALTIRLSVIWILSDSLLDDRDAYLAMSQRIADGRGLVGPDGVTPTAFRPPLLPMLLAGLQLGLPAVLAVTVCNLAASVVIVWGVARLHRRALGADSNFSLAVALGVVAVDPLLLLYTTQPMTEVLATAIFVWAIEMLLAADDRPNTWTSTLTGGLWGLVVLCRPVFWPLAIAAVVFLVFRANVGRRDSQLAKSDAIAPRIRGAVLTAVVLFCVTAPWAARNWKRLGTPIWTTTHGGYTLRLGNNEVFDQEVVQQPWGTVWNGESLERWQADEQARFWAESQVHSEVAEDRWMQRRATNWMREHPMSALQSSLLKLRRFWSVAPLGPQRSRLPNWVVGCVSLYGFALYAMALWGSWLIEFDKRLKLILAVSAVCFSLIHSVYWSNARFRAPLLPVFAIVASASLVSRKSRSADS